MPIVATGYAHHPFAVLFNRNDAQLKEFIVYVLRVFLLMMPVIGFQIIGSNYFMAVGRPSPVRS